MSTYLLDTSALLAHFFGEAGAEEVQTLFDDEEEIMISVISVAELAGRLEVELGSAESGRVTSAYVAASRQVAVNLPVARTAVTFRQAATRRLPLIDALIAASASEARAVLVHRDPHFSALPARLLAQRVLPSK